MKRRALAAAVLLAAAMASAPSAQAAVTCAPASAKAHAAPETNGSQFFLVYGNGSNDLPPSHTIWGHITAGLGALKAVAAKGTSTGDADGTPAQALAVISVTVSEGTP